MDSLIPFDLPLLFAAMAAFSVVVYVLADGFDLGVGILFLAAPRDTDRDVMMASIEPVWDGNETWLVMGGTLLFAAFPAAYYVLLPAFYLPIMFMLFALIFRGIAFGFRLQAVSYRWVWDYRIRRGIDIGRPLSGVCAWRLHQWRTDGGRHVFRRAVHLLHDPGASLRARPARRLRASRRGLAHLEDRGRDADICPRGCARSTHSVRRDDGRRQRLDRVGRPGCGEPMVYLAEYRLSGAAACGGRYRRLSSSGEAFGASARRCPSSFPLCSSFLALQVWWSVAGPISYRGTFRSGTALPTLKRSFSPGSGSPLSFRSCLPTKPMPTGCSAARWSIRPMASTDPRFRM